jgi:ornithine cyclodeaminase/alanine dehydrogenase-like protein (mu-crystallin family)
VRASDVVITCTTARTPILRSAWVRDGAFVAAIGADAPGKQELEPELLARARVVVDDLEACASGGELRHALAAGLMTRDAVAARLAEVAAGDATVRRRDEDVVVLDSTGIALEDVAAAALVYERAVERGVGLRVDMAAL